MFGSSWKKYEMYKAQFLERTEVLLIGNALDMELDHLYHSSVMPLSFEVYFVVQTLRK